MKKILTIIVLLLFCCVLYLAMKSGTKQDQKTNYEIEEARVEEQADVSDSDDADLADSSASKPSEPISPKPELSKEEQQRQTIEYFEKIKQEIFQGRKFNDQSTPAYTFLSFISAFWHEDYDILSQTCGSNMFAKVFKEMGSEARQQMLQLYREKIKIVSIFSVNESPKESELCGIYTSELPRKDISQVWTFGYIKGAWRFLGSTSEIHDWQSSAKKTEAMIRRKLQDQTKEQK